MAAKLTTCFSTGISQKHRCSIDYIPSEQFDVQKHNAFTGKEDTSEIVIDRNETSPSLERDSEARDDEDIAEENAVEWTSIRETSVDLSKHDFSMLKVGKHILQLPQLQSSSQDYRLNKVINSAGIQQKNTEHQRHEREHTQHHQHTRGDAQHQQHTQINTQYQQLARVDTYKTQHQQHTREDTQHRQHAQEDTQHQNHMRGNTYRH